jgi:Amt family ammonium transporter
MDTGDAAWVLTASALVLFMTPGLSLFYGGMVRSKNILAMLMQNFWCMAIVPVVWAIAAYSLSFGGTGDLIGNFDYKFLEDMTPDLAFPSGTLFMVFQLTFAVITPALITGAVADRMRWAAWAWFVPIWIFLVYAPIAKWVFGGGWLAQRGALDFAGGAVVHMNAGAAALVAVLILGKRKGWPGTPMPPHSLPLTLIGTGILWFGWFGFNAGSALAANGIAVQAFSNTFLAAAAATVGWLVIERVKDGHATTLGAASGAVAGLVAITPCAGFVDGMAPIVIGAIAGAICALAIGMKFKFGFDDSLDVVGVHLVGGLVGTLLLGFFADPAVNPLVTDPGVFIDGGGWSLLGDQIVAAAASIGWSFVVTGAILMVLKTVLPGGIRASEDDEEQGLDLSQHSETGYAFAERA